MPARSIDVPGGRLNVTYRQTPSATGAAWWAAQGSADALAWRASHAMAAHVLIGFAVAHVVTVSLHLLDLVRD